MFESLLAVLGITDVSRGLRAMESARIERIDRLVEGNTASVHGTVVADSAGTLSPLGEKRCLAWALVFEECGKDDDTFELGRSGGGVPFLLRSENGTARVVPEHLLLLTLKRHSSSMIRALGKQQLRLDSRLKALAARGRVRKPNWGTSGLRIREYLIDASDVVTVRGHVALEPDVDAKQNISGYREARSTRPVLSGTRKHRLLIC